MESSCTIVSYVKESFPAPLAEAGFEHVFQEFCVLVCVK
jgi:hypothetical protein